MTLRKTLVTATLAVISTMALSEKLGAASTSATITYTASGTFASPASSGSDTLRLGGEPFSVSIAVSSATKPFKTGKNWAAYNKLKLTGTVHSGLLGASPVNIASSEASIIQAFNPGQSDVFTLQAPVKVVGISLTIKAVILMPYGTIPNQLLAPFKAPVALAAGNASMTYANGTDSTLLAIQSGGLTGTVPKAAVATAAVTLHSAGAQITTLHADGTTSVRSIGAAPVDLGFSSDTATLKFYAAGVSGAADVQVQIAGVNLPVLYAGASGYFPGLDELIVQAPTTLIGRGATNLMLTVDGQTAAPVAIHIQ